jgi:hypothetical protein
MKTSKYNKNNSQSGVTLLMSILIVSGLVIIAASVSTLGLNEMRASRAFFYTEPAIGAAQSGAENALWAVKRAKTISTSCTNPTTQTITSSAKATFCKNIDVPAVFTVVANTPYVFYLFNPANENGDIDLLCATPEPSCLDPTYQTLNVTYISGSQPVTVTVTRLDETFVGSIPTLSSGTQNISNLQGSVGNDNRMKVTLSSTASVSVSVNTNIGLPSFPTLESTGCSGTTINQSTVNCNSTINDLYTRKLQVTVPQ